MPKGKKSKTTGAGAPAVPEDDFQSDLETALARCAANAKERKATRTEALQRWAATDIARLERVDSGGRCGWAMWEFEG
jgi:hypothetical protein